MKKMSLQELQECEFDILVDFQEFCDKYNLRYYLCGGTLIGAIRHKGFIPWDDDIDVMMPRPDLEKFLDLIPDGQLNDHIAINSIRYDENASDTCTRLYDERTKLEYRNYRIPRKSGCWIDIWPLDGLDDSPIKRRKQFRKARVYMDLRILNDTKLGSRRRNNLYTILQYILLPILPIVSGVGHKRWVRMMDILARKYDYNSAKYVGVIEGRAGEKEAMLKTDMEPAVYVNFGGRKFTAMANFDEYLTNLYGDYMTPPDDAGKASRHEIEAYWK